MWPFKKKPQVEVITERSVNCRYCGKPGKLKEVNGKVFLEGIPYTCDDCFVAFVSGMIEKIDKDMEETAKELGLTDN